MDARRPCAILARKRSEPNVRCGNDACNLRLNAEPVES